MGGLGTLEGGVPAEIRMRGRRVQAAAAAFAIDQWSTEALTAIVRDHRPLRPLGAHPDVGADGTPGPGEVAAEIARRRILVRVRLPEEGPRS